MLQKSTIGIYMVEKVFVDTSGWVALFVENDQHHSKARRIYGEMKEARYPLYTSDYIVDETITLVLKRGNHKQSVLAGNSILSSGIVSIVSVCPDYMDAAWDLYKKYTDKKFSFTDVTSFTIMKELGIVKAFSFDAEFAQAGFLMLGD